MVVFPRVLAICSSDRMRGSCLWRLLVILPHHSTRSVEVQVLVKHSNFAFFLGGQQSEGSNLYILPLIPQPVFELF